jgi:hypothetical protein
MLTKKRRRNRTFNFKIEGDETMNKQKMTQKVDHASKKHKAETNSSKLTSLMRSSTMTLASTVVATKQPPGTSHDPTSWKNPRARPRLLRRKKG